MSFSNQGYLPLDARYATKAVHEGQRPEQWSSHSIVPPITLTTTFKQDAPGKNQGFDYARSGNPSRQVLETALAALEDASNAICYSSGLGAVTSIVSLLSAGDHVICCDDVYGGTHRYFRTVASRMKVEATFTDLTNTANLQKHLRPNTRQSLCCFSGGLGNSASASNMIEMGEMAPKNGKLGQPLTTSARPLATRGIRGSKMVWIESPTNPSMKVLDIPALAQIAKGQENIIVVVDNTFLTSYFQRPLNLGADITMYSLTKYMNGHSDVIMGAAITNSESLAQRLRYIQNATGVIPSPFDCYLVNRSLKTLTVRMRQHMSNGLTVGHFLESHPYVEKVYHPGLPSHPRHEMAKKQWSGCSGMMSFTIKGGLEESVKFLSALKIFLLAESLGGYESLAEIPCLMTHASVPLADREALGITDNLIRLSVGLEAVQDLTADLDQALKVSQQNNVH